MAWVPQTEGTPNTHANRARAYWPGRKYVDWVGTDFYSKFPNFTDLETFYNDFPNKPFVFGEWALWGSDDAELRAPLLPVRRTRTSACGCCSTTRATSPAARSA